MGDRYKIVYIDANMQLLWDNSTIPCDLEYYVGPKNDTECFEQCLGGTSTHYRVVNNKRVTKLVVFSL